MTMYAVPRVAQYLVDFHWKIKADEPFILYAHSMSFPSENRLHSFVLLEIHIPLYDKVHPSSIKC